jgi:hypothetical protein
MLYSLSVGQYSVHGLLCGALDDVVLINMAVVVAVV